MGGSGDGGGDFLTHGVMTFDSPAKKKLRPIEPPATLYVTANDAVFSKKKVTVRRRCTSVRLIGSVGLSLPMPHSVDEKVLPVIATSVSLATAYLL